MYVKSDKRLIFDHDLVTVLVSGRLKLDVYSDLKYTHGYLNELQIDILEPVRHRLPSIVDKYSTNVINLNQSELANIKELLHIQSIESSSYLLITVLDILSFDEMWNLSEEEKINVASCLKMRGNYKAGLGNWSDAFKNYHRAAKYLRGAYCVSETKHELYNKAYRLVIDCMNNLALSCLKLSSGYSLCIKYCNYILSMESHNTKALFRKAKALTHSEEWDKALACIDKCMELEKDEKTLKEIENLRLTCVRQSKEQRKSEKTLYKDILDKMEEISIKRPESLDRVISYDIDPWDNAMADEMLSIQQELEAFGEQMPPRMLDSEFISTIDEED